MERHTTEPDIVASVSARLALRGLDLCHPFDAQKVAAHPLETFGRPSTLGLLVGNTRAMWPFVVARGGADPIDGYVVDSVEQALANLEIRSATLWAHVIEPAIPIQLIAEEAGLARLAPCHLSIHPVHGPWFALRAVVTLDHEGRPSPPAPDPCGACKRPCIPALDAAVSAPHDWRTWLSVRDACPIGRASRYSERQIAYHYTKDRRHLLG